MKIKPEDKTTYPLWSSLELFQQGKENRFRGRAPLKVRHFVYSGQK